MNIRGNYIYSEADDTGYRAPASAMFSGRKLCFLFSGNKSVTLEFSEAPVFEVCVDGRDTYAYDCTKIEDDVYFLNSVCKEIGAAYVIDSAKGLVTRIILTASHQPAITMGALSGKAAGMTPAFSDDLAGNRVEWVFGTTEASNFCVDYGGKTASVLKADKKSPAFEVADFTVVKITDMTYLQLGRMRRDNAAVTVLFLSNFAAVLGTGAVYEMSGREGACFRTIGACGRVLSYSQAAGSHPFLV